MVGVQKRREELGFSVDGPVESKKLFSAKASMHEAGESKAAAEQDERTNNEDAILKPSNEAQRGEEGRERRKHPDDPEAPLIGRARKRPEWRRLETEAGVVISALGDRIRRKSSYGHGWKGKELNDPQSKKDKEEIDEEADVRREPCGPVDREKKEQYRGASERERRKERISAEEGGREEGKHHEAVPADLHQRILPLPHRSEHAFSMHESEDGGIMIDHAAARTRKERAPSQLKAEPPPEHLGLELSAQRDRP